MPVLQGVSTFNDDIESTAAAVVASILGATQVSGVPQLDDQRFLLVGAGQANIGSARLLLKALQDTGLSEAEARSRIWMFDSQVSLIQLQKSLKGCIPFAVTICVGAILQAF